MLFSFVIMNMMKSRNIVLDSIEEFIALPLSILKNRIIQITGYKSDFISSKKIDVKLDDETIHINCVNSEAAYNLLSSVVYKRKLYKMQKLRAMEKSKETAQLLKA